MDEKEIEIIPRGESMEIKEFEVSDSEFNFLIETLSILEAFGKADEELTASEIKEKVPYVVGLKGKKIKSIYQLLSKLSGKKEGYFNPEEAPLEAPEGERGKYRLRAGRYKPKFGVFKILEEREDLMGEFCLEINHNGISLEIPKKHSISEQPLNKRSAHILYDKFNTGSSVVMEGDNILEIKEKICRISREDTMQQIIETQKVTWPLLFSDREPEIKINGKNPKEDNLETAGGEYEQIKHEDLSFKYFEVKLPVSSINKIKIENEGKLPICKKEERKLTTCLHFMMAGETKIKIALDSEVLKNVELLKNCEIMTGREARSPLDKDSPDYSHDATVAKYYEFREEDKGEMKEYMLTIRHEDFRGQHQPLFRSLREYGCLLRVHLNLKGKGMPPSFRLSTPICGRNCI